MGVLRAQNCIFNKCSTSGIKILYLLLYFECKYNIKDGILEICIQLCAYCGCKHVLCTQNIYIHYNDKLMQSNAKPWLIL